MNGSTSGAGPVVIQSELAKRVCDSSKPVAIVLSRHGTMHVHTYEGRTYVAVRGFLTDEGRQVLDAFSWMEGVVADILVSDRPEEYDSAGDEPPERLLHVRLA